MHSFKSGDSQQVSITNSDVYSHSQLPIYLRGDDSGPNGAHITDLGELEQSARNGFHHVDAVYFSKICSGYNGIKSSNSSVLSGNLEFGGVTNSLSSAEIGSSSGGLETSQFMLHMKGGVLGFGEAADALGNGHFENWGDSGVVADRTHFTDPSTDGDDKNQFPGVNHEKMVVLDSNEQSNGKIRDPKSLLKLAQNREAARKCRLRKKAYVQQLESSKQRLIEVEQNLKRERQQGVFVRSRFSGDVSPPLGCVAFDVEYTRWLDKHQRLISDLRSALNSCLCDTELHLVVEEIMSHKHELFRIKRSGAKGDIFHIFSGIWKSPAERCFMWIGGFRSSDLLKVLGNQIESLTEQQLVGICNLQQSYQQAEDALSQGMEALQQSIAETLSHSTLASRNAGNVVDYMSQMAVAMSKIATFENFLNQADLLRLQMLQQLQRILTTRQAARALLAINDYKSRLRALSSLWLARPKE